MSVVRMLLPLKISCHGLVCVEPKLYSFNIRGDGTLKEFVGGIQLHSPLRSVKFEVVLVRVSSSFALNRVAVS